MSTLLLVVLVFGSLLAMTRQTNAQFMVVELGRPYVYSDAAAIVVDLNNMPIPGALVSRMSAGWVRSLGSTRTNANGWFRFKRNGTNLYYLEITHPGFQVMHVKLKVVPGVKKRPRIKVEIAT